MEQMDATTDEKRQAIDQVRRDLMSAHVSYSAMSEPAGKLAFDQLQEASEIPWLREAYIGTLMASSYSYALAAVLKVAEQEGGLDLAFELAGEIDEMLTNGDHADWNRDIVVEKPVPAGDESL